MSRVLKTGVSGDDVKLLQGRLSELGFDVSRSGSYDARTETAVKAFQRSRDLKVDGDAGRNTLRALGFSYDASGNHSRILKRGVQGDDVRAMQERLRDNGQSVRITGSFDAATERAVESFQRDRGLKVDGEAGRETMSALGFTWGRAREHVAEPRVDVTPRRDVTPREVAPREVTPREVTPRDETPHEVTPHEVTPRDVTPRNETPHEVTPRDVTPRDVTPREVTPREVTPRDVTPRDVTPRDVTPLDVTPRDVTPRDVTPRDVTPRDVTPRADVTPHVHHDDELHVHDTPSTVRPARPATISRTEAFGDVRERSAIAARITIGRGSETNEADIAAVRSEVAKLPLDELRDLQRAGVKIVACRDSVVDAVPSLRNESPRGWPPGKSWEDVAGAYMPGPNEVVVSTREAPSGGREVAPHGSRHGSVSLVAHEAGHALDAARGYPSRDNADFQRAYQQDLRGAQLLPYYTQDGEAGPSEAYAESLAIYLSGDPNREGARRFPNLMGYWQQRYQPGSSS